MGQSTVPYLHEPEEATLLQHGGENVVSFPVPNRTYIERFALLLLSSDTPVNFTVKLYAMDPSDARAELHCLTPTAINQDAAGQLSKIFNPPLPFVDPTLDVNRPSASGTLWAVITLVGSVAEVGEYAVAIVAGRPFMG